MTTLPLTHAEWAYNYAGRLAGVYPYVFGGGHGVAPSDAFGGFPPTKGDDPEGTNPRGFDCSAWVSTLLWHAGVFASGSITNSQLAAATPELEGWGSAGAGRYFTVFVRDSGGVHHCLVKFTLPGKPVAWSAAAHTGTICGWQGYGPAFDPTTDGYSPRHYPGA